MGGTVVFGWVSVDDALPEDREKLYLCGIQYSNIPIMLKPSPDHKAKLWYYSDNSLCDSIVTHWIEVPPIPKPETIEVQLAKAIINVQPISKDGFYVCVFCNYSWKSGTSVYHANNCKTYQALKSLREWNNQC